MTTRTRRARPIQWWQLRVELLDVAPIVWRRLLVPASIALPKLHQVLQGAFGWTNSHLHEFVISGVRYAVPDPDLAGELQQVDQHGIRLENALGVNMRCFDYLYDFGDDWHHVVLIENQHLEAAALAIHCTGGENACPPEDVGGAHGYADFLAAIADPTHEQHSEYLQWAGRGFDPTVFDLAATNRTLGKIKI